MSHERRILNGQRLFNKSNFSCETTGVTGTGFAPNCLIQQDIPSVQKLCCYVSAFRHWERGCSQHEEKLRDSLQVQAWRCSNYVNRKKKYALRIGNICMKFVPPLTISSACVMETEFHLSAFYQLWYSSQSQNSVVTTVVIKNYNIKKCLSVLPLQVDWKNHCKFKWFCNEAWVSKKKKKKKAEEKEYSFFLKLAERITLGENTLRQQRGMQFIFVIMFFITLKVKTVDLSWYFSYNIQQVILAWFAYLNQRLI